MAGNARRRSGGGIPGNLPIDCSSGGGTKGGEGQMRHEGSNPPLGEEQEEGDEQDDMGAQRRKSPPLDEEGKKERDHVITGQG